MAKGLKNLIFSFLFGGGALFFGYLTRLYLARTITLTEFGLFYSLIGLIQLLTIFTNLGLGTAQIKYIANYLNDIKKVNGIIYFSTIVRILLSTIIFLIIYFNSELISLKYFGTVNHENLIIMGGILLIIITLYNTFSRVNNGLLKTGFVSFTEFFLKIIFLVSLISITLTIQKIIILNILVYILGTLILFIPITRILKKGFVFSKKTFLELTEYSKQAILTQTSYTIIGSLDIVMLTMMKGLESVAVYSVILPSTMALFSIGKISNNVIMPIISKKWAEKDKKSINNTILLMNKYSLFIILPAILTVLVFPKIILSIFFGNKYVVGAFALQILTVGIFLLTISITYQSALTGTTKAKKVTKITAYGAILNIVLNMILIPPFGINGAAMATTLAYSTMATGLLINTQYLINIKQLIKQFSLFLIPSLIFLIVINTLRLIQLETIPKLIIIILIGGLTYLISCQVTGIVTIKKIKKEILEQLRS